jgi:tetratricopeptide (TPR) repeat protein
LVSLSFFFSVVFVFGQQCDYHCKLANASREIESNPNKGVYFCFRAFVFLTKPDIDSARLDFAEAIKLSPSAGYGCRADYLLRAGKLQDALDDALLAVKASQGPLSSQYTRISQILLRQGRLNEALESINKEIVQFPQAGALYVRGEVHLRRGDMKLALADADEALKKAPSLPWGYLLRANVNRERNNFQDALGDYNKAVELNPEMPHPYYNRGLLNIKANRKIDAISDLKKALELDPIYWDAKVELEKLGLQEHKPVPR